MAADDQLAMTTITNVVVASLKGHPIVAPSLLFVSFSCNSSWNHSTKVLGLHELNSTKA